MSNPDGIDLSKSGWENPDGFKPRDRPERAPAPPAVCEVAGPDGWTCDLPPNHGGDYHVADNGTPEKVRWPRLATGGVVVGKVLNIQSDGAKVEELIPRASGTWNPLDGSEPDKDLVSEIRRVALGAAESDRPIAWAAALQAILEMTRRGY